MKTTPRTFPLRRLATGGAIAVATLAGATMFIASAVTQPDEPVHELSVMPLPSEEDSPFDTFEPPVMGNPFTDRLLAHEHRPSETEDSYVPLPSGQDTPPEMSVEPELYVESFTEEENALLNSDEPTHVEVDAFTGDIISVEKHEDDVIPANFGGSAHN